MRYLVIFGLIAGVQESLMLYQEEDRFFYYARDDEETLQIVDSQEPIDEQYLRTYSANPHDQNIYLLYTRLNPEAPQKLSFGDLTGFLDSNFDGKRNTIILVHGWNSHGQGKMSQSLKRAFLQDNDVNVVVVDWSALSRRGYVTAKRGTKAVGTAIGVLLTWIVAISTSFDKIHLVGFSLGAHVVGIAGYVTRSRVQRITGLEPAGPLWEGDPDRLAKTNGQYVEVIHTNTVLLGYPHPCGHADFYPNGGGMMPGCQTVSCSHSRAHEYMYASVKHNRMHANECSSLRQATGIRGTCRGATYPMGNSDLNKSRSGLFRINTRSRYPFF